MAQRLQHQYQIPEGRQLTKAKKYQGKFAGRAPRRARFNKAALLVMSILLLIGMTVGGTAALLLTKTEPETNTFQTSYVTCQVT